MQAKRGSRNGASVWATQIASFSFHPCPSVFIRGEMLLSCVFRGEKICKLFRADADDLQAIADQWGETPKAVESLLTRARQAFREAYQNAESADG